MKSRILLLALTVLSLSVSVSGQPISRRTGTTKVLFLGDPHWKRPVGNSEAGAQRMRRIIRWANENEIQALVLGGDYAWANSPDDSLLGLLADSLKAEYYPLIGNWEWTAADTGTGKLYNDFSAQRNHKAFFMPWVSESKRGRRWYGARIANSNVLLIAANNNRETPGTKNYAANNPRTPGAGLDPTDYDGISDPTSPQRKALVDFIQKNREPSDWVILVQHRSCHRIVDISIRPNQEGCHSDADSSMVVWLDQNLQDRRWILFEADAHQNKALNHYDHYAFSACMYPRPADPVELAAWSSELQSFALYDTVWSAHAGSALLDSLTAQGLNDHGDHFWTVFWVVEFEGVTAAAKEYYLSSYSDTVAQVDEWSFTQMKE